MTSALLPLPHPSARASRGTFGRSSLIPLGLLGHRRRAHASGHEPGIAARYPAVREIAARAGTRVYVAHDAALDRLVVVKAIDTAEAPSDAVHRFRREVRIAARMQHPHIVPVLTASHARDVEYFVMPYMGDVTLAKRLRDGPLPVGDAVAVARALAGALDHAHRQGVVHRDVKPANVLLADGLPVLVDFGIALERASNADDDERITMAGTLVGTPIYMSPEQCGGDALVDARTDVYALGAVLYEMLTGEPPFAGRDDVVLCRRLREPAPLPSARRCAISVAMDRVVARALSPDPRGRYDSAAALGDELEAALDEMRSGHARDAAVSWIARARAAWSLHPASPRLEPTAAVHDRAMHGK